jgi:serine/threonine protein phosphatase PrpC
LVLIPRFFSDDVSFCGVFDGTVGHDASEFISQNITKHLCETDEIKDLIDSINRSESESPTSDVAAGKIRAALRSSFLSADAALIRMCAEQKLHYASSTGVSAFLYKDLLTVAHIGDSKACIAKIRNNELLPEWLTIDHKPNMTHELKRIEENGGSLVWLHGNKPYIRGGDFFRRQANGEHPKQLNYSRAFGGKDLKMFGLSAEPDINHFQITSEDKLVLIGSDGLWDVLNPKVACEIALAARRQGKCATQEIVQKAIQQMPICGVSDNVTAIAIFLE